VEVPRPFYLEQLKNNPKITQNWDKAKAANKVHVAAMQAISVDADDVDMVTADGDDMREQYSSEDDQSMTSKSSDYVVSDSIAGRADTFVDLAAMHTASHPLEDFGYMPQFFGVARFAQNDEFRSQCLMDPGAAINVISPMLANRSAVERVLQNVSIFTGKRKTASVSEMVRVLFELMAADGSYTKYSEWFAVSDMGYNLLLGRKFCKDNGFTQFDTMLTPFESFSRQSGTDIQVAAIVPSFASTTASFARVQAPVGEARNKRKAKVVTLVHDPTAAVNLISGAVLNVHCPVAFLNIIEQRNDADNNAFVLLEFVMASAAKSSSKQQAWFWG
jgi:hypothetical protein